MSINHVRRLDPAFISVFAGALAAGFALFPVHYHIISFMVNYFAPLPLYFVGLGWGISKLVLAAGVAFGLSTIASGVSSSLVFSLTTLVPVFLISYRVKKGDPAGYIVSWVVGFSVATFLAVMLILSAQSINILELLQSWFAFFAKDQSLKNMQGQIMNILPGISSISWTMMCLVNASLAQRFLGRLRISERGYPLPGDTRLYENWDIVLAFCIVLMLTNSPLLVFIGKNIALMSCIPIFLVGLKAVYGWLEQFENPKLWLMGVVFMSIFLVWPGIIIVINGVLEPTFHLYKRWTPHNKTDA